MTLSAQDGPQINFGITLGSSGVAANSNEHRGPSMNDLGEGTMDPRPFFCYQPGQGPNYPFYGWPGCFGGPAGDFVPVTADTSGIAALFTSTGSSTTNPVQVTVQTSATSSSFRLISAFHPSTYPANVTLPVLMIDGYQAGLPVAPGTA